MHASAIDLDRRVAVVTGSGDDLHPRTVVPVAGMTGYHRAVGGGTFADHDAGTALRIVDRPGIFNFLCRKTTAVTGEGDCKDKKFVHVFCHFIQRLKI